MRLELAKAMKDAATLRADANELVVESGKAVPYPFTVGVIRRLKSGRYRATVWTPAASKPRGYRAAAQRALEDVIAELETGARRWPVPTVQLTFADNKGFRDFVRQAAAKPEWFGRNVPGGGGWELPAPEHRHHFEQLLEATSGRSHSAHAEDYTGPELPEQQEARGDLNPEGLTFPEWSAAAGLPLLPPIESNRERIAELARAWRAGEDPSDWRAEAQHARRRAHELGEARGETNSEGLTLAEWISAANTWSLPETSDPLGRTRAIEQAWKAGADPQAWRMNQTSARQGAPLQPRPEPRIDPAVKSARAYNLGYRGEPLPPELSAYRRIYELGREDGAAEG